MMVTVVAIVEVGSTLRLVAVGGQTPDLVLESAVPQCKSFRDHWRLFSDHRLAIFVRLLALPNQQSTRNYPTQI